MSFGKSKDHKKLPNSQDILSCVSDLEIFERYLGSIPQKPISSPLREDTNPSFSLFNATDHGRVFWKDFSTGESGDCFLFVMRLFNIPSKVETFNRIARDFNLNQFELNRPIFTTSPNNLPKRKKPKLDKTKRIRISVTVRDWKIKDKNYWDGKYGLGKEQLEYCNIFPISHYFVNGYCTKAHDLAYAFVEEKDGIQTFKIYQPKADKENKWINNNDFSTWELWTQLPAHGDVCIIASSRKDAAVIKSLFPSREVTACSLQSEGVNPKMSVVEELRGRFKRVFILYDNDYKSTINRGRIAGRKLEKLTGFSQIEIPDGCDVKDPSDYVDKYERVYLKGLISTLIRGRK